MYVDQCFHCSGTVYSSDESVSTGVGMVHLECDEQYQEEMRLSNENANKAHILENKRNTRIIKNLKRRLKLKIWQAIEWEMQAHQYGHLEIVSLKDVEGRKTSGNDYFGESTALRHVYDNTSSCSYSDTYGGDVYLYIGEQRYLRMFVWG